MSAEALSLPFPEPAGPSVVVHHGDCLDVLRGMADASIDAVVTDPPYELGFMGRKWDASGIAYSVDLWREVLRVLKPGGHLLAFGGTRTYHRMTCAIEDAGFEIRDTIAWMYGQGFPKSHNLDGAHKGWGTALKPAHGTRHRRAQALVGT
ncbi:DNA methyltransferase, partial [Tessaracoccus sp.]|uniref:DNA methyltransferase n=1 Tax=Tessaracoccus sp. TaxID=1971211 RepID=UPI00262233DB